MDELDRLWRDARKIDLTHALAEGIPHWPGDPRFSIAPVERIADGGACCHNRLHLGEHTGTHLDAPLHFFEADGESIDEIPLGVMFGRMLTVHVRSADGSGRVPADTVLGRDALEAWEALHGAVREGDAVFFHFGWDRLWLSDRTQFTAAWPALGHDLCVALRERRVRLVGTDCISVDAPGAAGFPAHRALLGASILIGENFNNLGALPSICSLAALPLPIRGGSGAPLRAVAFLPAE